MATNPSTLSENSGRITAPDSSYTYGSAKDDTTGTAGDGTPIKKSWMNDIYGFQQWLLRVAGIVPSGNAETEDVSDFGDALNAIFLPQVAVNFDGSGTPSIRSSINVSSLTDNSVGVFIVNYDDNMPNTDYICLANTATFVTDSGAELTASLSGWSVAQMRVETLDAGVLIDATSVNVAVFGDPV